ncbi:hypothetical protein, partial [Enterobacter cloacae complex sp. CH23B]|uniref:hypothetical protein n=1 Tax=Enterobacter cloacae complex sp. CH23B TaxID=2511986 RepID=UPI001026D546
YDRIFIIANLITVRAENVIFYQTGIILLKSIFEETFDLGIYSINLSVSIILIIVYGISSAHLQQCQEKQSTYYVA